MRSADRHLGWSLETCRTVWTEADAAEVCAASFVLELLTATPLEANPATATMQAIQMNFHAETVGISRRDILGASAPGAR